MSAGYADPMSEDELLQEIGGEWDSLSLLSSFPELASAEPWPAGAAARKKAMEEAVAAWDDSSEHSHQLTDSEPSPCSDTDFKNDCPQSSSQPNLNRSKPKSHGSPHQPSRLNSNKAAGANNVKSPFLFSTHSMADMKLSVVALRAKSLPVSSHPRGSPLSSSQQSMPILGEASSVPGNLSAGDISMDLLPSILENVAKRGKGGRLPSADPRGLPGVDPRKARRILANRESAARSKTKQRMMLATLKTQQDVLVSQRMSSTEELDQLRELCRVLQSKNSTLESRIKVLESSRMQASHSPSPNQARSSSPGNHWSCAAHQYNQERDSVRDSTIRPRLSGHSADRLSAVSLASLTGHCNPDAMAAQTGSEAMFVHREVGSQSMSMDISAPALSKDQSVPALGMAAPPAKDMAEMRGSGSRVTPESFQAASKVAAVQAMHVQQLQQQLEQQQQQQQQQQHAQMQRIHANPNQEQSRQLEQQQAHTQQQQNMEQQQQQQAQMQRIHANPNHEQIQQLEQQQAHTQGQQNMEQQQLEQQHQAQMQRIHANPSQEQNQQLEQQQAHMQRQQNMEQQQQQQQAQMQRIHANPNQEQIQQLEQQRGHMQRQQKMGQTRQDEQLQAHTQRQQKMEQIERLFKQQQQQQLSHTQLEEQHMALRQQQQQQQQVPYMQLEEQHNVARQQQQQQLSHKQLEEQHMVIRQQQQFSHEQQEEQPGAQRQQQQQQQQVPYMQLEEQHNVQQQQQLPYKQLEEQHMAPRQQQEEEQQMVLRQLNEQNLVQQLQQEVYTHLDKQQQRQMQQQQVSREQQEEQHEVLRKQQQQQQVPYTQQEEQQKVLRQQQQQQRQVRQQQVEQMQEIQCQMQQQMEAHMVAHRRGMSETSLEQPSSLQPSESGTFSHGLPSGALSSLSGGAGPLNSHQSGSYEPHCNQASPFHSVFNQPSAVGGDGSVSDLCQVSTGFGNSPGQPGKPPVGFWNSPGQPGKPFVGFGNSPGQPGKPVAGCKSQSKGNLPPFILQNAAPSVTWQTAASSVILSSYTCNTVTSAGQSKGGA